MFIRRYARIDFNRAFGVFDSGDVFNEDIDNSSQHRRRQMCRCSAAKMQLSVRHMRRQMRGDMLDFLYNSLRISKHAVGIVGNVGIAAAVKTAFLAEWEVNICRNRLVVLSEMVQRPNESCFIIKLRPDRNRRIRCVTWPANVQPFHQFHNMFFGNISQEWRAHLMPFLPHPT